MSSSFFDWMLGKTKPQQPVTPYLPDVSAGLGDRGVHTNFNPETAKWEFNRPAVDPDRFRRDGIFAPNPPAPEDSSNPLVVNVRKRPNVPPNPTYTSNPPAPAPAPQPMLPNAHGRSLDGSAYQYVQGQDDMGRPSWTTQRVADPGQAVNQQKMDNAIFGFGRAMPGQTLQGDTNQFATPAANAVTQTGPMADANGQSQAQQPSQNPFANFQPKAGSPMDFLFRMFGGGQ